MKILVTGGAGFIGSHLVDTLVKDGHDVLVIDDLSTGKKEYVNKKAKLEVLDISSPSLSKVVADFSPVVVYHLAAQKNVRTSLENPMLDAKINILGSLNLLTQAIKNKVDKFIFVSTGGIYGDTDILPTTEVGEEKPMSPYILNKLTFEKYLAILSQGKMKWAVLRLANVYGQRQDPYGEAGVISIFLDNVIKNKKLYINGDGQQTRDYVYIADVISALTKFLSSAEGLYNVGTGREISLLDLLAAIKKISGREPEIQYRPAILGEVIRSCLDFSKVKHDLSWQPQYDLKQGLELTYRWFKEKR
ncbi:MAG: hypothetical protein A2406_02615 [Candidatus Komeilibacteria bacterium RIFOXYC1_FULL_37_11]|uniref:NAD-dependent epimerase/dehydratase domain-containing protein n=1 Tax=Candidatus Komeilibacteria bacterium RIFOXYC1_FULL_37_11 TaxID=1798555 RepID=A0A1G2BZW4_9BACT|nr:MAG: hypothetical protein A2406_02615 [Candidatus Komeilibacteria bacterium RIFOXYC1_FULL_37_11]OGY95454.1 MAG: hypothetical protein A2611_02010 [Candidatus Komeilibacteria bacterium RIFOXYD1_FULL_37_29]OGY96742.1 MAG: hypothetical protein A2543_02535 [Candidatus Komeilibacteria bacterium RIFOXYD2_FULL_37_8]